jgi:hypothetical protein
MPIVTLAELDSFESIDAIAEAKAGIIQCLSNLFYSAEVDYVPAEGTILSNIELVTPAELSDKVEFMKNTLCAYACEELSAAKLIEALACKLAVEKGLIGGASSGCSDCCCLKK